MPKVRVTSKKGLIQESGSNLGLLLDSVNSVEKCAIVKASDIASTADSVTSWTQPAGTLITDIRILCTSAPTIVSGDIGYEVGTTSSGAQIVAAITDEILDGGTTVVAGALTTTTLVAVTQNDATHAVSTSWAGSARTVYLNLTASSSVTAAGEFKWIIRYVSVQ